MNNHFSVRLVFLLIFISVFGEFVFGQSELVGENSGLKSLMTSGNAIKTFDKSTVTVEGSEFLYENWLESSIFVKGLSDPIELPVKYNYLTQKILCKVQENSVFEVSASVIEKIVQSREMRDVATIINPDQFKGYELVNAPLLVMLVEEDYSLAAFYNGEYLLPNYNAALGTGTKNMRVNIRKKYFMIHEGEIFQLPSRRKKVMQFIAQFNDFSNSQKLKRRKLRNEQDYIDFFEELNS